MDANNQAILSSARDEQIKSRIPTEPVTGETTGEVFQHFPKLPAELQREIWRLAIPPRAVRFEVKDFGDSDFVGHRDTTLRLRALIPNIRIHPLLLTCHTSREVALQNRGQEYHLSKEVDIFDNVISNLGRQYTFHFNSVRDTVLFPEWKHFEHFTQYYELFHGAQLRPMRSSAVKSITLEHVEIQELDIKDITYYSRTPSDRRWHTKIWEILDWKWGAHLPSLFYEFPNLEELILIDFEVKPAHEGSMYDRPHLDDFPEISREWAPAAEEESIRMFVDTFEHAMKWQAPESALGRLSAPVLQPRSRWWQDPKITLMRREEFQTRFY